jgi:uncharacterized protein YhaN
VRKKILQKGNRRAAKREEEVQKEWKNWLTKNGLELELTSEGTLEIFRIMDLCVEKKS